MYSYMYTVTDLQAEFSPKECDLSLLSVSLLAKDKQDVKRNHTHFRFTIHKVCNYEHTQPEATNQISKVLSPNTTI